MYLQLAEERNKSWIFDKLNPVENFQLKLFTKFLTKKIELNILHSSVAYRSTSHLVDIIKFLRIYTSKIYGWNCATTSYTVSAIDDMKMSDNMHYRILYTVYSTSILNIEHAGICSSRCEPNNSEFSAEGA